jgi:hypothetical protein
LQGQVLPCLSCGGSKAAGARWSARQVAGEIDQGEPLERAGALDRGQDSGKRWSRWRSIWSRWSAQTKSPASCLAGESLRTVSPKE